MLALYSELLAMGARAALLGAIVGTLPGIPGDTERILISLEGLRFRARERLPVEGRANYMASRHMHACSEPSYHKASCMTGPQFDRLWKY